MPTRPATIPLTRPPTVTRPTMKTSRNIQAIIAVAAARFVLRMAAEASAPAKYGSPPLNPFQPSHSKPAPVITAIRLLGRLFSRSVSRRGPMTDAATSPETPAATWITYPPEKSRAPAPAKLLSHDGKAPIQPPPQMLNALTE